ncbi:universal stress protein [Streptomyces sp. H27-H1]|uniref:universal stress protein n=1 Tax=Streptomyces sp. H27-H1 TaxID=2996461 RepID=UPI00226EEDA1|nr:universal stress protein [Streptomyces sp. H27-H1]MCY0927989.1 universal stress protein [Streptomyces sp. H27-H1]
MAGAPSAHGFDLRDHPAVGGRLLEETAGALHALHPGLEAAHDSALVLIGRRIRTSAFGTHFGSVAHAVVHHCAVPVAVVAHD